MKGRLLILFVILMLGFGSLSGAWTEVDPVRDLKRTSTPGPVEPEVTDLEVDRLVTDLESYFIENRGQLGDERIRYYAPGHPLSIGLMDDGVVYSVSRTSTDGEAEDFLDMSVFTMRFVRGNVVEPRGVSPLGHHSNFFIGNDPDRWASKVTNFAEVLYEGLYDGIDLRFYFHDGMFKYDFIVDAGIDPSCIEVSYDGIKTLDVDQTSGDLLISTGLGVVRDMRPIIIQEGLGEGGQEAGDFRVIGDASWTFDLPAGASSEKPMVIDPGLLYSTYFGGAEADYGTAIAVDDGGNFYFGGGTNSTDFLTTTGAYEEDWSFGSGSIHSVFISKFDSTGTLLFSTYFGGSRLDGLTDMKVGPDGNLYVLGNSQSLDLPTSVDSINASPMIGGNMFLIKLKADGSDLMYCTYLGGSNMDYSGALHVDDEGTVFMTGWTYSNDLPVTPGAYCSTISEVLSNEGCFYLRISNTLDRITACTYIDGSMMEELYALDLDGSGNVVMVGKTSSSDFPITTGAWSGGVSDAVVTKMAPDGTRVIASTFLGGSDEDVINDVVIHANGSIFLTGVTGSIDFPTTPNAIKDVKEGYESFLTVFNETLTKMEYSTYIGGADLDLIFNIEMNSQRNEVYLYGRTWSIDLPTTPGCFDPKYSITDDNIIIGIRMDTFRVSYLTYYGGDWNERPDGGSMAIDWKGVLYCTGWTSSQDLSVTSGAVQNELAGVYDSYVQDAYVYKLDPTAVSPPSIAPKNLIATGENGGILLSWDPVQSVVEGGRILDYTIYRGTKPDELVEYSNISWGVSGFIDDDVNTYKRYFYKVSASSSAGPGAKSNLAYASAYGLPESPINLTLGTGNGTVELKWEAPSGPVAGYWVYRGETRAEMPRLEQIGNVTEWVDDDVEIGTFYYYSVQGYNAFGDGIVSEAIRIKPLNVPSPPTAFWAEEGDGFVKLTWGLPTDDGGMMITGFEVWRSLGGNPMTVIATLDIRLSFKDTDVVNGKQYTYFITAFSEVGRGYPTTPLDATPYGKPGKVLELAAQAGDGSVTLTWEPPSNDGGSPIIKYVIYWGTDSGNLNYELLLGNITTVVHYDLTNGQTYHYQINGRNQAGDGPVSSVVHATPMGLPGTVRDLVVDIVPSGVKLSWTAPAVTGGATSLTYKVLRGTTDDPRDSVGEVVDIIEFLDDDVTRGMTYYYRVLVLSSVGDGPLMDPIMVTPGAVPEQVTGISPTTGNSMVALAWSAPDDGGYPIVQYIILRGIFETGLTEIARVEGTVLNFTDGTVENGKTYLYKVYARNAIGDGPLSDTVSAQPQGPPNPPRMLEAMAKGKTIELSWTAPTGGNTAAVTGYRIYRGESETDLTFLAEVGNVLTYTDEDVKAGKTYYYKVVATSDSGDSEMSQLANGKVKEEESPGFGIMVAIMALGLVTAMAISKRGRHLG
jgi:fibronectin type 3 domain-containing protein